MEKLFELHTSGRFDLLVLDTPPTRNALDFLDAPKRLTQFIEGRSLRVFMKPTGLAAKVAGRGASVALSVFKRIVGFDLLADLAEFFNAFSGMVDGFQARAKRVNSLLADRHTCFLVVCGPQGEPIDEAVYFHRKLVEAKLPFGGVIVNKVHYPAERLRGEGDPADLEGTLAERLGDEDLARRVRENFADYQALAERDARNIEHLARELRTQGVIRVPYLDEDVHDLGGLAEINRYLFASSEERIEIAAGRGRLKKPSRAESVARYNVATDVQIGRSAGAAVVVVAQLLDLPVRVLGDREEVAHAGRVDALAARQVVGDRGEVECALLDRDARVVLDLLQPVAGVGDAYLVLGRNRLEDAGVLLHVVLLAGRLFHRCGLLTGYSPFKVDSGLGLRFEFLGDGDRYVARVEAGRDQGLVGGLVEVGAELAEGGVAHDPPHALLDPAGEAGGLVARRAGHLRALELHRRFQPLAGGEAVVRGFGDKRRGAHRQRGANRALTVEHGAQRQQVVAQAFERRRALAAELEAAHRPGQRAGGVGTSLQRLRQLDQLARLILVEPVAVGARGRRAGGDAPPAALAGRREGVRAEPDAAPLIETHDADQVAELSQRGRGGIRALALLGDGEELRLPGGAAHALAAHRLDRRLEAVGADEPHPVRKLQARDRHLQADERRDQHVGLVGVADLGVKHVERLLEPLAVERELAAAVPEAGEEDRQEARRPLARLGRDLLAPRLQVGSGDIGEDDRFAGRLEGGQGAQLALALAHVARRQRDVAMEEGVVGPGRLGDVEGNLVPARDQRREASRRLGGKSPQRLVEQGIAHARTFPPAHGAPAPARRLANYARRPRSIPEETS